MLDMNTIIIECNPYAYGGLNVMSMLYIVVEVVKSKKRCFLDICFAIEKPVNSVSNSRRRK